MSPGKATAPPMTATKEAPADIPFRKSAATSTPEVLGLLVTTMLLLAAAWAVLWFARRRGWLDRWVGVVPIVSSPKKLVVLESLRVTRQTTIHRIKDGETVYLLTESTGEIQMIPAVPGQGSEL